MPYMDSCKELSCRELVDAMVIHPHTIPSIGTNVERIFEELTHRKITSQERTYFRLKHRIERLSPIRTTRQTVPLDGLEL
jgi:hypothetical protein